MSTDEDLSDLAVHGSDAEWFLASGMCGHCGNGPDDCECTPDDPCGCRLLHTMGSAHEPALAKIERGTWACPGQEALL